MLRGCYEETAPVEFQLNGKLRETGPVEFGLFAPYCSIPRSVSQQTVQSLVGSVFLTPTRDLGRHLTQQATVYNYVQLVVQQSVEQIRRKSNKWNCSINAHHRF